MLRFDTDGFGEPYILGAMLVPEGESRLNGKASVPQTCHKHVNTASATLMENPNLPMKEVSLPAGSHEVLFVADRRAIQGPYAHHAPSKHIGIS
jgi:hypothetical protein